MSAAQKAFETTRARLALRGVALYRTDPADGPGRVFVEIDGAVKALRSIEDLRACWPGGWPNERHH